MKPLIAGGAIALCLTLAGAAPAAAAPVRHTIAKPVHAAHAVHAARAKTHVVRRVRVARVQRRPVPHRVAYSYPVWGAYRPGVWGGAPQLISYMFGLAAQIERTGQVPRYVSLPGHPRIALSHARSSSSSSSSYDDSQIYDSPADTTPIDNSASEAAIEASDAATAQASADLAATEAQNDAAQAQNNADMAAAQQTEINANN